MEEPPTGTYCLVSVLMLSWWSDEVCMSISFGSFLRYIYTITKYNMNISTSKRKIITFKDKKKPCKSKKC
jgi:hypothetical protein